MFSSSVGRSIRCTARPCTPIAAGSVRPLSTTQPRAAHQRRHSSSKTSVPPDGSKRIAPEQQAQKQKQASTAGRKSKRNKKADAERRVRREIGLFTKQYPHLPVVRPTSHMKAEEAAISTFFAQHRPISVTTYLPESISDKEFDAIFQPRLQYGKQRTDEVITTLGHVVEELELEAGAAEPEIVDETIHLDATMPQHLFAFQPPPPPPEPVAADELGKLMTPSPRRRRQKGKSWQTTIIVTEYHGSNGQRTFQATSTPIIRLPVKVEEPIPAQRTQQPFLERMRVREQKWRASQMGRIRAPRKGVKMVLISVKRQRKAKMKKHKLKKLRKRTRNLRRKLGKL